MFGILTAGKKKELLTAAIDDLQGRMTERGSLSSTAEKLGKEILRVFRSQVATGQPTTDGKNLVFAFSTSNNPGQLQDLTTLLSKEGATKSVMDLNAAFDGKIKIEKNQDNSYTFTLKAKKA